MICSCAPMFNFSSAPPDVATTEYQISNHGFSYFSAHVLLWFSEQPIHIGIFFSVVIMGNVTHILPVLQWFEVVIAFVSSKDLFQLNIKMSQQAHVTTTNSGVYMNEHKPWEHWSSCAAVISLHSTGKTCSCEPSPEYKVYYIKSRHWAS